MRSNNNERTCHLRARNYHSQRPTHLSSPRSRRTLRKPPRLSCSNLMISSGKPVFVQSQRLKLASCWTALQTRMEVAIVAQTILFPLCVCLCPDRDSGNLHCVVLCFGFHRCSFVDISSCQWRLMTVRKEGWMAVQVRLEEILAKAVTIDGGRDCWYCRYCSETNVWTRSQCRRCQTNFPCKASTGRLHQPRASSSGECEDKVCWHARTSGIKRQKCANYVTKLNGMKVTMDR